MNDPSPGSTETGAAGSPPRRRRLAIEVAVVLAVKFAALVAIWSIWFDQRQDYRVDGEGVARAIYAAPAAKQPHGTTDAARP